MSATHTMKPAAMGGPLLNKVTFVSGVLVAIMALMLLVRFVYGLGAVANVNDGYPWGIWVVVDIMIASAFACGGFSVAFLVYILNKGEYHPLVRPALLASLFGYTLAGFSAFADLGRWWNFWHVFWPGYANPNSVMLEVALCVSAYVLVMWLEFAPVLLEKFGKHDLKRKLNKVLFFIIALGTVLPMMHQSSLGTMVVVMGVQVNPLWQTQTAPLLYLLTAVTVGYGIVLFESCLSATGYRTQIEMHLLTPLAKIMLGVLGAYLAIRFIDLTLRGVWVQAFKPNYVSLAFWIEQISFVAPFFIIGTPAQRRNPARLFLAGITIMIGTAMLRLNGYLIGYDTGPGWTYFPSFPELMITVGMFATEVLGYILITRRFPVLPREAH